MDPAVPCPLSFQSCRRLHLFASAAELVSCCTVEMGGGTRVVVEVVTKQVCGSRQVMVPVYTVVGVAIKHIQSCTCTCHLYINVYTLSAVHYPVCVLYTCMYMYMHILLVYYALFASVIFRISNLVSVLCTRIPCLIMYTYPTTQAHYVYLNSKYM